MKTLNLIFLSIFLLTCVGVSAQNAKKHYKTGEEFIMSGNFNDAVDQLTKALGLEPDMDKAYLARADAYEQLGMLSEAAEDYDRASTFLEKKPEVFHAAGRLYYELEEYDKSLKRLDRAILIKRNFVEAYQVKVKVLLALDRYEEALRECDLALSLKETSENYYYHGLVQMKIGNLESAEMDFADAVAKDRRNVVALRAMADVRIQLGRTDFALQNINSAIQIEPNNTEGYVIRSRAYVKKLDYPKAINDVSKVLLLEPENSGMYQLRGQYYQEFNQHSNAINDFTRVLMMEPGNAEALYKRAWSNEQVANYKDAIKDYEALVGLSELDVQAQILLKEANARLFELYREENNPEIVIIDPAQRDAQMLQFPKDSRIVSIKGKLIDESAIKELKIGGLEVQAVEVEEDWEFLAAIDIEEKEDVLIEVTDVYDNVTSILYTINLTEVVAPEILIIAPYASDNGVIYLDSDEPNIYVEGRIEDESLIETIMINGVLASYIPGELNPRFTASLNIMNQNKINVSATDVFGNITEREFRLNRDAALISENNPMGKTWAIFIENSNYETFASLDGPTKDVILMRTALAKYQVHNVIHKQDMNKTDMEKFFSIELRDLVRSNRVNSILIWFAGHGKFINETGYWIPIDSKRDDEFTYFNINALKASLQSYSNYVTHTLVITDACESGPSFYQAMRSAPKERNCDDWQATKFKSSQVFASAGYELAVDNSQFTRTFANSLANNPNSCIPIESIVNKVTSAVVKNNQQKPKFGKIDGLEDEDGTFFFISKDF
ncbi:MAG TPA: tetratricopeptide repeat protein [Bacteroides sp.]|nr:tetratricopeptide repeat protein [Bacteroides sp.]